MQYKVVPYTASVSNKGSSEIISNEIEQIINSTSAQGWTFQEIQEITIYVHGTNGCFGLGAQPGYTKANCVIIFKK